METKKTEYLTARAGSPGLGCRLMCLAATGFLSIGAKANSEVADFGPDPTFEGAVRLVEAGLRETLIDPQSAQIEWPYNFVGGSLKSLFGRRRAGWYTCGWVNAKNRMGGYTGRVWFLAMVNSGKIIDLDVGTIDGVDAASATCPALVQKGIFAPAPRPAAVPLTAETYLAAAKQGAADAAARGGLGITFQATLHGALLIAVGAGTPAERSGLKPGETIERVNDIAIAGLDQATMQRIFTGAGGKVSLDVVGVGKLVVDRTPQ